MGLKLLVMVVIFFGGVMRVVAAENDEILRFQNQNEKWQEFHERQKLDNERFRDYINKVSKEEKAAAYKDHRAKLAADRKAFLQEMYQTNFSFLKKKLEKNVKMTELEKIDLVAFFESQFDQSALIFAARYAESVMFFSKIANDPNMPHERKKKELKAHVDQLKAKQKARQRAEENESVIKMQELRNKVMLSQENDDADGGLK